MHESIFTQIQGSSQGDIPELTRLPHSAKSVNVYVQYRTMSYLGLKNMNKMVKLNLLQLFFNSSEQTLADMFTQLPLKTI